MIAVINGPSSRRIDSPIRLAMKSSAPNCRSGVAAWKAMINPIRKLISATIGSALTPAASAIAKASRQRTLRGWTAAYASATLISPTKLTRTCTSRHTSTVASPISTASLRRCGRSLVVSASVSGAQSSRRLANSGRSPSICRSPPLLACSWRRWTRSAIPAPSQ